MSTAEINTKNVKGRRRVHYDTYDDALADAEQLASGEVRTLGNWSYGQILRHLAMAVDTMIDGAPFRIPKPVQFMMRLLMKKRMLRETLSPGFRLPKRASALVPPDTSVEEGLQMLRTAIERLSTESKRAPHAGFGVMTPEEWDQFQLRHFEMHMSFVLPADSET